MIVALFGSVFAAITKLIVSRQLARRKQAWYVFISYAREDLEIAKRLAALMKDVGLRPWLDVEQLFPGQLWHKSVLQALEESSAALVIVSANLQKHGFVNQEVNAAMKVLQSREADVIPIIPVKVDDSKVPEALAQIQWVDLRHDGAEQQLLRGLSHVMGLTVAPVAKAS